MPNVEAGRLRVLTMNLYGPENPDWERRHRLVARTLQELRPDVVALQEVPLDGEVLERLLGPGYHFSHLPGVDDDGVGGTLATLGQHRLLTKIDLRINERVRDTLPWCGATVVETDTALGPVLVAHHKPAWPFPFEAERERQAVLVAQALEELAGPRDAHAVVLGDFDATPDSASILFWRGRRAVDGLSVCYQDAWEYVHPTDPGYTFDLSNPLVRSGEVATAVTRKIDHVLVRSGLHGPTLEVVDCRRVLDHPVDGVWASDHFGVLADLALPTNVPGHRS